MTEYHKIQTVFLRDPSTNFKTLLRGQYAQREFQYLADLEWVWTEKVDGMNIRVMHNADGSTSFGGKTDAAQIPATLVQYLRSSIHDTALAQVFGADADEACLYGEGYGAKIQGGGKYLPSMQSFVLFDVRVGDVWLNRVDVEDIAHALGIGHVPVVGRGSLPAMVARVMDGFNSMWGDFIAEGIVARPAVELIDRRGRRIITKIKHKDFAR